MPVGSAARDQAVRLAAAVKIYRDRFGTPHIDGATDEAVAFGFAYAQAEDFFWQVEDSYLLSLGRYSEVYGPQGMNSDLLNRAFEVVPRSQAAYARFEPKLQRIYRAFAAGFNWYLACHPEVKPRLITRFEPWHVVAYGRQMILELTFRYTHLSGSYLPRSHQRIWTATGSNGWAVAPSRTRDGHAMLMVNPHLPWFGFAQLYEAHLRSGQGWSFTGATTFGNPALSMGHNEWLGWALTTNEPDIADLWRLTFDDPANPLRYRYAGGYRTATEWTETIKVKVAGGGTVPRNVQLRKTHYGPVVARENKQHFLAAQIAGLENSGMLSQWLTLVRARNFPEFRRGLAMQQFPLMNIIYADRGGNIFFLYNALVPRREARIDWTRPVDGSDPKNGWGPFHTLDELPSVLNPPSGYVQNCNSTPFTTCRLGSPRQADFPPYMVEDAADDKRRAKMARELLEDMRQVTFDEFQLAAYDNRVYWALKELPLYKQRLAEIARTQPALAQAVRPYLEHLLAWDGRITADSTAATLCAAWYDQLYGQSYPSEKLLERYKNNVPAQFEALVSAALRLSAVHGTWRVRWGDVFRTQRPAYAANLLAVPFDDAKPSLASVGGAGPMGVIFTQYYTPDLRLPFVRLPTRRYGVIGTTYLAVYEFGDRVRGASALNFGASGNPNSPHYFDQAPLMAERKLKTELFYWPEVLAASTQSYHPGEEEPPAPARPPVH